MCLSFQIIFSWDIAYVVYAILDRISGFEPSPVTIIRRYLNWLTVSSLLSLILMSPLLLSALFVIPFVFLELISMPNALAVLSRCLMSSFSYSLLPPRPLISSANCRLVMTLPPILMVPAWSCRISFISLSKKMLKRVGESKHPYHTPVEVWNHFPNLPLFMMALLASL